MDFHFTLKMTTVQAKHENALAKGFRVELRYKRKTTTQRAQCCE